MPNLYERVISGNIWEVEREKEWHEQLEEQVMFVCLSIEHFHFRLHFCLFSAALFARL